MTAAVNGAYGSYNYQSPESRALSSITQESYDYRDQGKLINKLTGDVSYLASYMRKMQQGIDSANQNVVQQLQSLINDFLVIIGGGGDTGFDFGDLKYVLQAIGALFGFGPGLSLPINLGQAASHFFSEYVLGLANFEEAINVIIDTALATILDLFGEIPIIGQAAQGLAVFISGLRDGINTTIDNLGDLISDLWNNPVQVISNLLAAMIPGLDASKILTGQFAQNMINGLTTALTNLNKFINDVIDAIESAFRGIPIVGSGIANMINGLQGFFNGLFGQPTPQATIIGAAVPSLDASKVTTGTLAATTIPNLDGAKITTGSVAADRIAALDAAKITTGSFGGSRITDGAISNLKLGTDISGDKIVAGTVVAARVGSLDASKITTGTLGTAIVPNLDAAKITTGTLGTAIVPNLDAGKITTGAIPAARIGSLPTSQITTGTFGSTFIADSAISNIKLGTDISGDKIVAGTVVAGRVGVLDASKITTGTLSSATMIPNLDATKITTGTLSSASMVPVLDASKVTTGNFAQTRVTNLTSDLTTAFSAGVNLAADPSFENANLPILGGTEYSTEFKRSGTRSVKLIGLTGANVDHHFFRTNLSAAVTIPVQENDTFYFEAWVRGGTGNTKFSAVAGIRPYLYSGDPAAPTLTYPANIADYTGDLATFNAGWNKLSGYYTVPAGGVGLRVVVQCHTSAGTGAFVHVDDLMCYRVTEAVATNKALYNANIPAATVLAGAVPSLDASKVTTGQLAEARIVDLSAGKITSGSLADARIPNLATSKITSGTFGTAFITDGAIANAKLGTDISGDKIVAGTVVAGRVGALDASKITTGVLGTAIIPTLDQSKITDLTANLSSITTGSSDTINYLYDAFDGTTGNTGKTISDMRTRGATVRSSAVAGESKSTALNTALYNSQTVGATILAGVVPSLDATKITTGQLAEARIVDLSAAKITSGSLADARIPNLAAGKITSGTFGAGFITDGAISNVKLGTDISGDKIAAGTVVAARVGALDASKVTTGNFAQSRVTNLTNDFGLIGTKARDYLNLVAGSDFDGTVQPWNSIVGYFEHDTVVFNSGTKSLKVTAGAVANNTIVYGDGAGAAALFEAKPGEQFYTEMWVRRSSTWTAPDTSGPRFRITRGNGASAGTTISNIVFTAALLPTADTWTKLTMITTMVNEPGVNSIAFMITGPATAGTGTLWIDDIVVRRINSSATIADSAVSNIKLGTDISGNKIAAGTVGAGFIAALDAAKITTGTFANAMIASGLDAAKLTTGTLPVARIGSGAITNTYIGSDVDAAKLTAGTLPIARIADSAITTAKIGDSQITGVKTAGLDASKVTTGTMAQAQVASLSTDLGNRVDYSAYLSFLSGGTSNLCTNPSFEDTTQYLWSGTANTNATYVRSGTRSVSLTGVSAYVYIGLTTSKTGEIYIQGGPSEKYYFEFYVKGDATNTTTGSAIAVNIGIWTRSVSASLSSVFWTGLTYDQIGTTNWVKASGYITVPADAATAYHRPIIFLPPTATAGKFYFDDILLENVTDITATNNFLYGSNTPTTNIQGAALPTVIDASKLTTGTLPAGAIGASSIDNTKIASGVDAAKLTTGTLPVARIGTGAITNTYIGSDVDAAKLTAGTLPIARIADSAITTVKIGDSQVTGAKTAGLDASKITGGTIGTDIVPALPQSKITGLPTDITVDSTLIEHAADLAELKASRDVSVNQGKTISISFVQQANSASLPTTGNQQWATSYLSGSGPTFGINGGKAAWVGTLSDRVARVIYLGNGVAGNETTLTDYQVLRGILADPPTLGGSSSSRFIALARVASADSNSYVWARAYWSGLSLLGQIGCTVNGVETIWQNNVALTWSTELSFKLGIDGNPRSYQVFSGSTLVTSYNEGYANLAAFPASPTFSANGTGSVAGITNRLFVDSSRNRRLVVTGTAGTFTLTVGANTTTAIAWNATAATVQAALVALASVGAGNATVTGTNTASPGLQITLGSAVDSSFGLAVTSTITGGAAILTDRFRWSGSAYTPVTSTANADLASSLGSGFRRFGAIVAVSGGKTSGTISSVAVSDNPPVVYAGSVARMSRASTGTVSFPTADTGLTNFFDTLNFESLDIDGNLTNGTFTVTQSKMYIVTGRVRITDVVDALASINLQLWNGSTWSTVQRGVMDWRVDAGFLFNAYPNGGMVGASLSGTWLQYLNAGNVIRLSTQRAGGSSSVLTGTANGAETYFSISALG